MVIISGGIDISMGSLLSLCNVLLVILIRNGMNYLLAITITLVVATAGGFLNGIVIAYMRVPALLTTFATATVFAGIALIIMPVPGSGIPQELTKFYYSKPLGIPMTILFILIPYIIWKLFKNTPNGIKIYAIGANQSRAFVSGIGVEKTKIFAYSFAGFSTGMGALAITFMVGGGDPLIGSQVVMPAISAAVIGGVSLSGGKGDITGGILGALFLGLMTNLVVSAKFDTFTQDFLSALILLCSIVIAAAVGNKRNLVKG